jgi:hypothetical protein
LKGFKKPAYWLIVIRKVIHNFRESVKSFFHKTHSPKSTTGGQS